MKKYAVFTDCDLDGVGTYAVFRWFVNKPFDHNICSQSNFRKTFMNWSKNKNLDSYEKIYIFDLDVSHHNMDLVDRENVTIIDHHDTHFANVKQYKRATALVKPYSSCCKLIYTMLKQKKPDVVLTKEQKMLIGLVDDYDSYQLKFKESYNMNVVLWNYVGNRLEQFLRDFGNGFHGFNQTHLNMIHMNNKKVSRVISELEIFAGQVNVSGKARNFYATMASESLNEVAKHVIDNHECDICMIVNPKTSRVSFRMNKERAADVDLGKLAEKIADGGGHAYSSGGKLTEQVMTLTKMLEPVR